MKIKDIKGLLPKKEKILGKRINLLEYKLEGKESNRIIDKIGEKDLNDYIELDAKKIERVLYRELKHLVGGKIFCRDLAKIIAKADIIKVKEDK